MFQAWLVKIAKIEAHSAPSWLPGNRPMKKVTVKVRKPSTGTRLEDVERGDDDHLGAAALRRQGRDDEGEDQRRDDRREHPQRRAQRVFGQHCRIERDRRARQPGERGPHAGDPVNRENGQG